MEKQNSGFMNKFQAALEKYVVPVAMKISQQKHLAAIRDGLTILVPITIIGGFAILLAMPPVDASVKASGFWPFLFVTVITIGEMCFSPLRNAFVSKYAPKKYLSLLMGVIAISTFGANKLSPFVQAFIEKFDVFPVFVGITVIMLVFTALIFLANKKLNSLVEGKEEA